MSKKLLLSGLGLALTVTIAAGAALLWATPEAELSLRGWLRDLLRLRRTT